MYVSTRNRLRCFFSVQDGTTWLLDNPDESLGYILADSGFDVWIANTRGTKWSLKHQSLDPTKPVSFLIFS